jgi:molecular chaperone HtpG
MAPIIENSSNNNIPDDLALSILSKLPLKSLKRFTCVRKSWSLVFDNPYFMSMYCHNFISNRHYANDNSCLLLKKFYPSELIWMSRERFGERVNLDWLPPPPPPRDIHSRYFYLLGYGNGIHGILCICEPNHLSKDELAIIWNPTTGESLIVPPSPFSLDDVPSYYNFHVSHCGFGYDHASDDYKLIRCANFWGFDLSDDEADRASWPKELPKNIWEIYSVRSNTWKKLDINMVERFQADMLGNDMYLNGVCHWISNPRHGEIEHLVSFNLSTEAVRTMPFPLT